MIVPVVAPVGTVTVRLVALAEDTVPVVPLNFTVLDDAVVEKFAPVMVTVFPATPSAGMKLVIVGALAVVVPVEVPVLVPVPVEAPVNARPSTARIVRLSLEGQLALRVRVSMGHFAIFCMQLAVKEKAMPKIIKDAVKFFFERIKNLLISCIWGGVHLFSYIHICTKHPQ